MLVIYFSISKLILKTFKVKFCDTIFKLTLTYIFNSKTVQVYNLT